MTNFGYTLMTEQSGPKDLVRYAIAAEQVGFDFEACSDHYSPWPVSQGHAPYAWTVLGAVAGPRFGGEPQRACHRGGLAPD